MDYLNTLSAKKGHFYTVGVGPGTPELVTAKTLMLVQTADVIVAPRSKVASESIALKTVEPYLGEDQHVYEHIYSMSKDQDLTLKSWNEIAEKTLNWISEGKSVVHITIGDPLIYSTSHYLLDQLEGKIDQSKITVVPGISAFQTIGAKFKQSLSIQEGRFTLMTGTDVQRVDRALDNCETLVLYKCGKNLEALANLIEKRGMLDRAKLVCYADQDGREVILEDLSEIHNKHPGYMATIIVYVGRADWN